MDLPLTEPSSRELFDAAPLATVGIWRLTSRLYAGTWTDLFLAQPADAAGSPRTDYVVKLARQASAQPSEGATQVAAEVAAAAAVNHPHVVAVLDASLTAVQPYCVMPRLEGGTLAGILRSRQRPELPVALWWARQCAQGLSALHAAGWVHRDVKPSNLIVSPRGHLTLIDLGFAARTHSACAEVFRGTAAYAAPETLVRDAVVQPASDLYAVGCILREMTATDAHPSHSACPGNASQLPGPVRDLIETLTSSDPAQRPSAAALVDHLLRLEIETLGRHIRPDRSQSRSIAA